MIKYFWIVSISLVFVLASCTDSDDKLRQVPTTLNFSQVLSFTTDTLDLDITNNLNNNSIYISYSDIADIYSENVIKYDLTNLSQTNTTHYDDSESKQIEVIDNTVFSISYNYSNKFDLDLNNNTQLYSDCIYSKLKATSYNNNILFFSGKSLSSPPSTNMNITHFNTTTETFTQVASLPNGNRFLGDGIVFNDNLYVFGGNDGSVSYNEINIYDLINNTWTQDSLPFNVFESFTSVHNNSVIVAGNKNSDSSGAFIGVYDLNTNIFSTITTSLNLNDITIRGITVVNNNLYIIYSDFNTPFTSPITMRLCKASLL